MGKSLIDSKRTGAFAVDDSLDASKKQSATGNSASQEFNNKNQTAIA